MTKYCPCPRCLRCSCEEPDCVNTKGCECPDREQFATTGKGRHWVRVPGVRPKFESWLERGDGIAVFQNEAFDSATFGQKLFMPMEPAVETMTRIGKTHAPDGAHGTGWKYILREVAHDIDRFDFSVDTHVSP